jgi:hypothetical protein
MSYSSLKHLAHGLALQVLQRWSIWLLLVEVVVGLLPQETTLLAEVVRVAIELAQDYLLVLVRPTP